LLELLLEDLLLEDLPLLALGLLEDDLLLLERELLAFGLLEDLLLLERELPDFALARLLPDLDDFDLLLEVLVSPFSARSLFTVRAAISAARPFWPRFS
jgi:hypothetical protein